MLAAYTSATCDASGVLGPPGVQNIVLAYNDDSSIVIGGRFAPHIDVRLDGAPFTEPRLRFLSSDTTIVAINGTGDSLIARRIGSAIITAVLESSMLPKHPPAVTQRIDVTVGEIITDRPTLDLSSIGDTATLRVTVLDIHGLPVGGIPVVWSSSDTTIAVIDARGRVTARGNGAASLFGIVGIDTVTTALRVAQQVARISFTPISLRLDAIGATAVITALARDRNDSLVTGAALEWTVDDPTVVGMDMAGTATARRNGTTWVRASVGLREDSIRVIVDQRAVLVVISAPSGLAIPAVGDQLQLVALGFDRMSKDVTDGRPAWYSLDPVVAQVDAEWGYVRGLSSGPARIVATQDGAEDTVVVQVSNIPVSLTVLPEAAAMSSVGDTLPLQVTVRNARGDIVGASVVWHTPNPNIVAVTDAGRVIGLAAGTARVVASASGLADTAVITITNNPSSIDIIPTTVSLRFLGDTISPEIVVRNARGDLLSPALVTWTSDRPAVATVSEFGRVTGRAEGVAVIHAFSGALRDSVRVSVSNGPQSIVLSTTTDTLTAPGQMLTISSVVRDVSGVVMNGYATVWVSTNPAVATVSSSGIVTSSGYGTVLIIGQAGAAADTAVLEVRNPTTLYVDNGSTVVPAYGTRSRPFSRIGNATAIATPFDTIFVTATGIPYAETVAIQTRITLLGDSSAYVAGARDAERLPTIAHDSGATALSISGGLPVTVRYFTIDHAVDGPAIDARASDVRFEHVHVNPGYTVPVGSGILIADAPAFAIISNSSIRAVRGYGIRLTNSAGGRLTDVDVRNVGALSGAIGAGIQVTGGSGAMVERATLRNTAGPQVQMESAASVSVTNSDFAGRWQLLKLLSVTGTNMISGNSFNLTRQPGEPFTLGSETDGRSGLEIQLSGHVTVTGNAFLETQTGMMDAIRLIDARGMLPSAATILTNRFQGGRYHIRSLRSNWEMTGVRSTGAKLPIVAEGADTIRLTADTLENVAGTGCVRSSGGNLSLTITGSILRGCTVPGSTTGGPAIAVTGTNGLLSITDSDLSGPDQTGVDFIGRELRIRRARMTGRGNRTVSSFSSSAVVLADATGPVEIVGNVIAGYEGNTGLLMTDGDIRADSNRITQTGTGIRVLNWKTAQLRGNDIFGNLPIGLRNDRGNRDLVVEGNWWGDGRGPRGTTPAATGDTLSGRIDASPFATTPHFTGTTASALRAVRGDGQSSTFGTTLPMALTVRAVDSDERPVAGVAVTFTVTGGVGLFSGSPTRTVTTDASGLAEASLTLGAPGTVTITVSAPGLSPITMTATSR